MILAQQDCDRIAEEIRAAEERTSAEIVCVLAARSSNYSHVPPLWAAFLALAAPWPLLTFTDMSARLVFATQIAVFIGAAALIAATPLRFLLTPRDVKRARAYRAAEEQFFSRGVASAGNRAGVLIYVSLAERFARIVVGEEVARKIPQERWRAALDMLLAHMLREEVAEGFCAAIKESARLLAPHLPPGGEDELPNKIYVM